jgi:uncharacterized protein (TIGR03437 family)
VEQDHRQWSAADKSGRSQRDDRRQVGLYQLPSPGQINLIAPDVSPVAVTVTNSSVTSTAFMFTASQYSPASLAWPGNQAVATHLDFSIAAKAGTFRGYHYDTGEGAW